MILIAHRGNIDGKQIERENTISYILEALGRGYDVEIDIRYIDVGNNNGAFYLGHDDPQEVCPDDILVNDHTWVHAKDIRTFKMLLDSEVSNTFFHQSDDTTLTSSGYMWTQPGKELTSRSIQVMPEYVSQEFSRVCHAICSDYVGEYEL